MDLQVEVAGNFMELRSNHFHSGIDLKTNGRTGQRVKATGDGWVSRIKISPWGYGKAVYISHPSGYTTVYGHLDRLHGRLASTLLELQYSAKSFSIDHYFKPGELPVQQGEVIAYSGNTGGSSAPHLHYEVRRTADQHALDPEAYGVKTLDKVPPIFAGIRLRPLDSLSRASAYPDHAVGFPVVALNDSTYALKPGTHVAAWGVVGLEVNVTDRYSNSTNTCGIRTLAVSVDGTTVCDIRLEEVDFGVQRYANAYMEYSLFKDNNMHYNRCYKLPNNRLDVYQGNGAPGRIAVEPGKAHTVQVVATDPTGNRSTLTFVLQGATREEAGKWPIARTGGTLLPFDRPNVVQQPGMRFSLPPNALYEDTYFKTTVAPAQAGALAPLFTIQDELTPLQLGCELSIEVGGPVPGGRTDKLLVVRRSKGKPVAEGGRWADGRITASVRTLGQFTVMMDTTPPVLTPVGLLADMKGRKGFKVRVKDNLSGLDQWSARLDGQWILMEYEPKTHALEHHFDVHSDLPGTHEFELEVTDERGNRSRLTRTFTR
ncbi:MAG TPA: M23 family metallopeptidase [Flavobacteriales bacterium]|nr:M23 family metallopeptidase [Flavobacteriales bacterium]HRP81327.1 M23 family metallopeptidase [Flavobacteriales bacterium]